MKKFKSHFKFNKQERRGIFFLLLIIVLLQGSYFLLKYNFVDRDAKFRVDSVSQIQIDSLKAKALTKDTVKLFPFNPNFITDYKGYVLGMSPKEIDRLHSFRKQDRYVNSTDEFQKVTQVSDSLLKTISPYFKFTDWANQVKKSTNPRRNSKSNDITEVQDLNLATAEELKSINGIGDKLSARIVKFRDRLGGFLINAQLYDVYGLEPEVVERALKRFQVLHPPEIKKINVNTASVDELASLIYIRYDLAERVVAYRELNGSIETFDELASIEGFPKDKIDRIGLYLSL